MTAEIRHTITFFEVRAVMRNIKDMEQEGDIILFMYCAGGGIFTNRHSLWDNDSGKDRLAYGWLKPKATWSTKEGGWVL